MHLLLTDRLTCPRCGPDFGLILRADRMEDRRVLQGAFGCPNCRDTFPIVDGFGDLRAPPRGERPGGLAGAPDPRGGDMEGAARSMALLGVAQGPGTLALVGSPVRQAAPMAEAVEGIHVLAIDPDLAEWPDVPGVSRMMAAPGIPVSSRALRGVVIDGRCGPDLLGEAARVVAPRARVVVLGASADAAETLTAAGLRILAEESGTVVAARG